MMNITPLSPDYSTSPVDRRRAIDLVATLRARAIRVALFGQYCYRPDPDPHAKKPPREGWITVLQEQVDVIHSVFQLVSGRHCELEIAEDIRVWIAKLAANDGDIVSAVQKMHILSNDILQAAICDTSTPNQRLGSALDSHFIYGREKFFVRVTAFCDALWQDVENERAEDVVRAVEAARTISTTLTRLERIGKHVRLVSLNASVEASRVGDDGKGLAVIAVEFKSLAEEIQQLSANASESIEALMSKNGAL